MDVALMTEGTYPHSFGGVSVWCDQLVRGLTDHDFQLVALVGTGLEPPAWKLPDNVTSVTSIPLWGTPSAGLAPGRRARRVFRDLLTELIEVLLGPPKSAQPAFGHVLREFFYYAQYENLDAAMRSADAVRVLTAAWQTRPWATHDTAPTVHDALAAVQLLASSLRPLSHPPAQANIAHCVANGLAVLPALAAKWAYGTPFLLTEHGIYLRERYLGFRVSPYRWPVKAMQLAFLRQLCALAYYEASMVAPGNVYNKRWEERLGAPPAVIRTVYNGVDPEDFPAVDGEPEVLTVSWAGRIDPIKDLETLLRAFALVHKELPECRLRIFGGTAKGGDAYLQRCRQLAGELGIDAMATFEGRVPEIRDAYAAGHIFVLSSISEGFPYTLIEAMTCGRACVATNVGGVAEALADTGLVIPPRDPAALAQACLTLLRDTELRKRLGAQARTRALEFFTVDRAVGTFDELYNSLAVGRPLLAAPAGGAPDMVGPVPTWQGEWVG
jgi:glycosyltransferase involved in cell wall biosynthesis